MTITREAPVLLEEVAAPPRRAGSRILAWVVLALGAGYFFFPLIATANFSLRAERGTLGFLAYARILSDPGFLQAFTESAVNAVLTIVVSLVIIVPTAYWVTLRLPRLRSLIEFITLLPFVVPAVVLVFGLIRMYSRPPVILTFNYASTRLVLILAYATLSFPYMYRSVDNGLRAMNVRTLTEAAQSLGASWTTILFRIIFPGLRVALLSGALLTFAIVLGELTVALYLGQRTLGPFMANIVRNKAHDSAALTILVFGLTWLSMGVIAVVTRRAQGRLGKAR
jgi:putative spermidine/putrescine transport system permease protein